jgi:hypothetical protein
LIGEEQNHRIKHIISYAPWQIDVFV